MTTAVAESVTKPVDEVPVNGDPGGGGAPGRGQGVASRGPVPDVAAPPGSPFSVLTFSPRPSAPVVPDGQAGFDLRVVANGLAGRYMFPLVDDDWRVWVAEPVAQALKAFAAEPLSRWSNLRDQLAATDKALAIARAKLAKAQAERQQAVAEAPPELGALLVRLDAEIGEQEQAVGKAQKEQAALQPLLQEATATAAAKLVEGARNARLSQLRVVEKLRDDLLRALFDAETERLREVIKLQALLRNANNRPGDLEIGEPAAICQRAADLLATLAPAAPAAAAT